MVGQAPHFQMNLQKRKDIGWILGALLRGFLVLNETCRDLIEVQGDVLYKKRMGSKLLEPLDDIGNQNQLLMSR